MASKGRSTRVFGRGRTLHSAARALQPRVETKNLAQLEDEQEQAQAAQINERIAKLKSGELKPLSDAELAKWHEQTMLSEGEQHMKKRWNEAGEAERRAQEAQKKYGKAAITEAKHQRLVESYQTLGLTEEEAKLATSIHRGVIEDNFQRLYEAGLAMGLSESEARRFAEKR